MNRQNSNRREDDEQREPEIDEEKRKKATADSPRDTSGTDPNKPTGGSGGGVRRA